MVTKSRRASGRTAVSILVAVVLLLALQSLSSPCLADPYFDQGVNFFNAHQWDYAIRYLGQSLKTDSKRAATYYYIGAAYQGQNDAAKAAHYFKYVMSNFKATREARLATTALAKLGKVNINAVSTAKTPRAPSSAASVMLPLDDVSKLPESETVPFYRVTHSNHLLLDCYVNEKPIRVMFDTGAYGCYFGMNHLRQLGITPPSSEPTDYATGVAGTVKTWKMPLDIRLGKISRRINAIVSEQFDMHPLLGQDFFREYTYDTDDAGGKLHFVKKGFSGSIQMPYDTVVVPFRSEGRDIIVDVQINGRSHPCIFDTGAYGILFTLKDVMELGLSMDNAVGTVSSGVGGSVFGYSIKVDRMQLGPILKTNIDAVVNRTGPSHPLLGQSFYKGYRFVVDNESHVIKFWR